MSITSMLPPAIPVAIGGENFLIQPFTVNEISQIQAWIDNSTRTAHAKFLGELDPIVRQVIASSIKAPKSPKLGSEEANESLMSIEGLCEVFRILITRSKPSVTPEEISTLKGSMTFEDFSKLMESLMEIAFGKDTDPKSPGVAREIDWEGIFRHLSERYTWTPQQIAQMTMSQIREYCKEEKRGGGSLGYADSRRLVNQKHAEAGLPPV